MREHLQDRRPSWFGHLERMEENAWSGKCGTFKVFGSFPIGGTRKTCTEIIRRERL